VTPTDVVLQFCDLWKTGDIDAIVASFTDDAVYHNIPMAPAVGRDAIRTTIESFASNPEQTIEFRVLHVAAAGDVVLTERVDVFTRPGKSVELPVMGTFEVVGGRIAAWRDYFDLNQFLTQMA
jgi:limonene-1,2-epoxide hydrolase